MNLEGQLVRTRPNLLVMQFNQGAL